MDSETITIGMTAYNAEDTIAAALDSALAQDVPVEQIIVVDDVSSDRTVEIVDTYRARHPQIELIRHEVNSGVAAARNSIVKHARGTFLAFFDDDDISSPNRVGAQRTRILDYERDFAKGAAVICHTARMQIYPDGIERIETAMGSAPSLAPNGEEVIRYTLMGEPMRAGSYGSCATCSQMARTETYGELEGFDVHLRRCEDSDLALRHAKTGGHLVGLGDPLVTQLMTGTSDKSVDTLARYWLLLLEKHRDSFDSPARYDFARRWNSLKFNWLANRRAHFIAGLAAIGLHHPVETARRLRSAMPNLSGNRALNRLLSTVSSPTDHKEES